MRRITPVIAIILGLLFLALGTLQWRWIGKMEEGELFFKSRRIGYAAWLFKCVFDHEIESLARAFEAGTTPYEELAAELTDRRKVWNKSTQWPGLLKSVYRLPNVRPLLPNLDHLTSEGQWQTMPWPSSLATAESAIINAGTEVQWLSRSVRVVPEVPALIVPLEGESDGSLLVLELDRDFMASQFVPDILRWLFPAKFYDALEVVVVESESGRVLFSNSAITSESEFGRTDTTYGLVPKHRDYELLQFKRARTPFGPPVVSAEWLPEEDSSFSEEYREWFKWLWHHLYESGHWRLLVRGSHLPHEQQAAHQRFRNAGVGFGILGLSTLIAGALILVTRRTQRRARHRMELMARVSHELRTPLTVLGAAGENLADNLVKDGGHLRHYGWLIQKETRRLQETVENVLHLARRDSKTQVVDKRLIDLVKLVEESLQLSAELIEREGFEVERHFEEASVPARVEPRSVRSAILNLLSNALKYGRRARWLRLTIEHDSGNEIRIAVQDRGPGIPDHELTKLFEPYFRGGHTRSNSIEGTGLGLAVVHDVMDAHGGRVSVASEHGVGTIFTLHFPIAEAS